MKMVGVAEIHDVVHIELIPASAGKDFAMASGGGGRCIQPREIGDQPWIAPRCVAQPDPDYAVALDDGPAAHPGGAKIGAMWICYTCSGVIESDPMIHALSVERRVGRDSVSQFRYGRSRTTSKK